MSDDKPEFGYGEGRHDGAPFLVACADDVEVLAQELERHEEALREAGHRVEPDSDDGQALRAWPIS